jgi:TRAP-type C4-dicarboxylate transport system permease small subunit
MTRREALLFRSFAIWTIYVWVTRMWNIAQDHAPGHGLGFKLVHAVLAVISCAFAIAVLLVVSRMRNRQPVDSAAL